MSNVGHMSDDGERIAALEVRAEESANSRQKIFEQLDDHASDLRAIRADVHEIKQMISGYKGFASGVIATIATFSGILGAAAMWLWSKFTDALSP